MNCENCNFQAPTDEFVNGVCPDCTYWNTIVTDYEDSIEGEYVSTYPAFGVELETIAPDYETLVRMDGVSSSGDGSIRGGCGVEYKTEKASGKKGEQLIKKLCRKLALTGHTVNASCGLHVHFDGASFHGLQAMKDLFGAYLVVEDILLSFLPRSRRTNRYCAQLRDSYHLDEIKNARTKDGLEAIWYRSRTHKEKDAYKREAHHESRYRTLNMHVLFAQGHYEVRSHSGTIDAEKVLQWILLNQRIAKYSSRIVNGANTLKALIEPQERRQWLYDIVNLPDNSREYFERRAAMFKGTMDETITE